MTTPTAALSECLIELEGRRGKMRIQWRGLLLMLHRAGQITLPPVRYTPPNPLVRRERPGPVLIDTTPLDGPLRQLQHIEFEPIPP